MPDTDEPVPDLLVLDHPRVSILIAARNEEATILDCLRAVSKLNFPVQAIEVVIGNDQSSDQTRRLVAEFIGDKPNFHLVDITERKPALAGKTNVLAQITQHAHGQLLFFTDADTQVPVDWLTEMSRQYAGHPEIGIVTGRETT